MKKKIIIGLLVLNFLLLASFIIEKCLINNRHVQDVNVKVMYCKAIKDKKNNKDRYLYINEYGSVTQIVSTETNEYKNMKDYESDLKKMTEVLKKESTITINGDANAKTISINQTSNLDGYFTLYAMIDTMEDNYKCSIYEYE